MYRTTTTPPGRCSRPTSPYTGEALVAYLINKENIMTIPYRTRRVIKRLCTLLLTLSLVAVFVLMCWLLWLDRFLVYTKDGVYFDFNRERPLSGALATPTEPRPTIPIHFGDDDMAVSDQLQKLAGFYITEADISAPSGSKNPQADSEAKIALLIEKVKKLPAGTPVMLEIKNAKGRFFYDSNLSTQRSNSINTAMVNQLIDTLNDQGVYLIARLPAFRDYYFGLNNVPSGLHHSSGRYLWMDEGGCYWLNPAAQGAISYLAQILSELKGLGFDEAVFDNFCFPETENILFTGDKDAAIASAAKTLVTACATDAFAVSFMGKPGFPLPEGKSRLYMEKVGGADCEAVAGQTGLEDTETQLVFIAESMDTRYDKFSVLRPIDGA